jgi:transposase
MEPVAQSDFLPDSQPRSKRSYRSAEERRRIVEETLVLGASVAKVARAHGINANQVFSWRKLHLAGKLRDRWPKRAANATHAVAAPTALTEAVTSSIRLLPVSVSAEVEQPARASAVNGRGDALASSGSIELTLPKMQVRISGQVDVAVLRLVLECLRG